MKNNLRKNILFAIASLLVSYSSAWAGCKVNQSALETNKIIDFNNLKLHLNSRVDNSKIQVNGCKGNDSKYIQIALLNLDYQDRILANEYLEGQPVQSQCKWNTELPFKQLNLTQLNERISENYNFVRNCLVIQVVEKGGNKVTVPENQNFCQVEEIGRNAVSLKGTFCHIKSNPNHDYEISTQLNKDCLKEATIKEKEILLRDYETRLLIRETDSSTGQSVNTSVLTSRDTRWSLAPIGGLIPLSYSENNPLLGLSSVIPTNVHAPTISLRPVGSSASQIDVKYFVENFSDKICGNGVCIATANYHIPLVAAKELYRINKKGKKELMHTWHTTFRIPPQWSGLATSLFHINLGKPTNNVLLPFRFTQGEKYILVSRFYEPKSYLDLMDSDFEDTFFSFLDFNNLEDMQSNNLPSLPGIGGVGLNKDLPSLPSVNLDSTEVDLSGLNNFLNSSWSHTYNQSCDSKNQNCTPVNPLEQPFTKVQTFFKVKDLKMDGTIELGNIWVKRESKNHGNYTQKLTSEPGLDCL